jgi:hypothetical protein
MPWTLREKVEVYCCLLLTSTLDGGDGSKPHPSRFTPGKSPGTYRIGSWVGPRTFMYRYRKRENLFFHSGVRTLDHRGRSELLYGLHQPGLLPVSKGDRQQEVYSRPVCTNPSLQVNLPAGYKLQDWSFSVCCGVSVCKTEVWRSVWSLLKCPDTKRFLYNLLLRASVNRKQTKKTTVLSLCFDA